MVYPLTLRFRDLVKGTDTINEHTRIIAEKGEVWWGWWKKRSERRNLQGLADFSEAISTEPVQIGLFDRSTNRFFLATVKKIRYSPKGIAVNTPCPDLTPVYYRIIRFPAWFCMTEIEHVEREVFITLFGEIPTSGRTLFLNDTAPAAPILLPIATSGNSVLHVSDIHFGVDHGFNGETKPGKVDLLNLLSKDSRELSANDIGIIVVSGDTTSRGNSTFLTINGFHFLTELQCKLGLNPEHLVIVPGNHDFALEDWTLDYPHEEAFIDFLKKIYSNDVELQRFLHYEFPNGRNVEILTINSVKFRVREEMNYGWVDWQSCEEILRAAGPNDGETLRIAVLHHHLVSALRDEKLPDSIYPYASVSVLLNAGQVIEGLQQYGFRLVLHGHQHSPAVCRVSRGRFIPGTLELAGIEEPLFVVGSGSAGAKSERLDGDITGNCYTLITVNDEDVLIRVREYGRSGNPHDLFETRLPI